MGTVVCSEMQKMTKILTDEAGKRCPVVIGTCKCVLSYMYV